MSRGGSMSPGRVIWACWLVALTAALLGTTPDARARAQEPSPAPDGAATPGGGAGALTGGATIDQAAVVEPGSYEDTVAMGESRFYALTLPASQIPAAAIAVDVAPDTPSVEGGTLHLGILDADRRLIQEAYQTIDFPGSEQRQLQAVAQLAPESGTALSTYFVGVALRQEAGAAPAGPQRYPVRLVMAGVERPEPPAASPSASEAVVAPSATGPSRAEDRRSSQPMGLPAGLVLGACTLSFLLGAVMGFRRVRARQAPLARRPRSRPGRRPWSRPGRRISRGTPATRQLTGLRKGQP